MFVADDGLIGKLLELCTAIAGLLTALVGGVSRRKAESNGKPSSKRQPRWHWTTLLLVLVAVSSVLLYGALTRSSNDQVFWRVLNERDPATFSGSQDGHYDIARLIPDRPELSEDQSFVKILHDTNHTFDVAVIDGHRLLVTYANEIEKAVRRGVAVRIIMFDSETTTNEANCRALAEATKRDCTRLRAQSHEVRQALKDVQGRIANSSAPGSLEVRLYPRILLYTMWIKDRNDPASSMGLLRVHLYYDHEKWPSFVFSKDGRKLIENLAAEFKAIWDLPETKPLS